MGVSFGQACYGSIMRYLGGKARQAKKTVQKIRGICPTADTWIEPFCGGGSVLAEAAREFSVLIASDIVPDLIFLWSDMSSGWTPPAQISKNEYDALKHAAPSALRAWAGYAASYNGKWFSGYGPSASGRDYLSESLRGAVKKVTLFKSARFFCRPYWDVVVKPGDVVYCDPPYAGTEAYSAAGSFDHEKFWLTCNQWAAAGASVFVHEYTAPPGWESVLDIERTETMNWSSGTSGRRVERLYAKK